MLYYIWFSEVLPVICNVEIALVAVEGLFVSFAFEMGVSGDAPKTGDDVVLVTKL